VPGEKETNTNGLSGLLDAVLAQTSNIQAADSTVDSKANNLMAAALVIVALLATQLRDGDGTYKWLAVISMFVLIVVVAIVLFGTRNRTYRGAVVDLSKHEEYFAKDNVLLLAQLVEDADAANTANSKILEDKRMLFRHAIFVFIVGFVLGIAALFMKS
jgi:hypothetical protein